VSLCTVTGVGSGCGTLLLYMHGRKRSIRGGCKEVQRHERVLGVCPERCDRAPVTAVCGGGHTGEVSAAGAVQGMPVCYKHPLLTRGAFRVAALVCVPLCTWGPGRLAHL